MFLFLPLLLACGDKADEVEDPAAHACEELGSGEGITASTTPEEAPALTLGEGATVSLPAGEAGWVALSVNPGEYLLFADTADVVTGIWLDGVELDLPTGSANEDCPTEIPEHFDLDIEEGGTYGLRLGPSVVDSVWLMLSESEGHGHEE